MGHSLWHPLVHSFEPEQSRLQLRKLDSRDNSYVLTFAALGATFGREVIYLEGAPMIVSVGVRYLDNRDERTIAKLARKIANLEFLPATVRKLGAGGQWYLIDFRASYNLRNYYDWLLKNGKRIYADEQEKDAEFTKSLANIDILTRAEKQISNNYDWTCRIKNKTLI